MQKNINENPQLIKYVLILLIVFNVFFPKSGIKIDGLPITTGMVLLFFVLCYRMIKSIVSFDFLQLDIARLAVLLGWMPFQIWLIVCFLFVDISDTGAVLSMCFNFIFLPVTLIAFEGNHFRTMPTGIIYRWINYGVIFVSVFGIIAFFYKLQTGDYIEIPFLTVNYDDYGALDSKHIDRGLVTKLISTYQNGNIFGVCILMLLPLYCSMQKKLALKILVKIALVLTLSRTVWIGLIVYEILSAIYLYPSFKRLLGIFFSLSIIGGGIVYTLSLMNQDLAFLFDPNLGGRLSQFQVEYEMLPQGSITSITEVVYAGVMYNFGIFGLVLFLLAMISPIIGWMLSGGGSDRERKSLFVGYVIYLIVAGSDGAILLIPVMIFYWFLVVMMTSRQSIE